MLVDGASARLGGTSVDSEVQKSAVHAAAWTAQPAAFQQACGCARADAEMLEAGWAAAEWAFGPACAAHPRRHVFARRGRGKANWQHARLIGQDAMVPWWAVARWSWCGRVRDAGTMRGRWRGSVVAERGLHAVLGGGSHCQLVRTGFWRQMVPRHRGGELLRQRHLSRSGLSGPRARP